jgi:hypothetical protein
MLFQINFTGRIKLFYRINTEILAANNWAELIQSVKIKKLCPINHKSATGNNSLDEINTVRQYLLNAELTTLKIDSII